ncbi:MAG: hypothetical protein ACM30H_03985 [Clostridia bacterium]
MWTSIDDTGKNLARWLREVARGQRADPAPAESAEAVLRHLEARTGLKLRSQGAIDLFLRDLAAARVRAQRLGMRRGILRGALLLLLLVAAFLQYYYWSVNLEIASLPSIQVYGLKPPQQPR